MPQSDSTKESQIGVTSYEVTQYRTSDGDFFERMQSAIEHEIERAISLIFDFARDDDIYTTKAKCMRACVDHERRAALRELLAFIEIQETKNLPNPDIR